MLKTKTYSNRCLLMLAVFSGLTACEKKDLPPKPEPSAFAAVVANNTVSFPASGGTANIEINGGTNGWWITMPTNNWCVITKQYGSGDFRLPVNIRPNTSGMAREITVTIHPTFNQPPVAIKLSQSN